jgi:hypothetical protein
VNNQKQKAPSYSDATTAAEEGVQCLCCGTVSIFGKIDDWNITVSKEHLVTIVDQVDSIQEQMALLERLQEKEERNRARKKERDTKKKQSQIRRDERRQRREAERTKIAAQEQQLAAQEQQRRDASAGSGAAFARQQHRQQQPQRTTFLSSDVANRFEQRQENYQMRRPAQGSSTSQEWMEWPDQSSTTRRGQPAEALPLSHQEQQEYSPIRQQSPTRMGRQSVSNNEEMSAMKLYDYIQNFAPEDSGWDKLFYKGIDNQIYMAGSEEPADMALLLNAKHDIEKVQEKRLKKLRQETASAARADFDEDGLLDMLIGGGDDW